MYMYMYIHIKIVSTKSTVEDVLDNAMQSQLLPPERMQGLTLLSGLVSEASSCDKGKLALRANGSSPARHKARP